jgi:hypothetical protein
VSFVLWRAYIGPPFKRLTDPYAYDWSVNNADASATLTSISTVLSAQLLSGASTASVNTAGSFPASGGFWVGPTLNRWTWINYSGKTGTTLTGLQWSTDGEEDITHGNGSQVKLWYEISENNGQLTLTTEMDANLATIQWSADIGGGVKIPQIAIRNNHLIIVQKATAPGGTFTNWLVGWLQSPTFKEPSPYRRQWSAQIVSSAQMIAQQTISGVRVSDLNIARDGSASGQSTLAAPYKERYSGDYLAAEPDLSATTTTDGSTATTWIAEHVVGAQLSVATPTADPVQTGDLIITQAHLSKAPGESDGYRWIEITVTATGNQPDFLLIAGSGGVAGLGTAGEYTAQDKIIFAEDDVLFQQQNPLSTAVKVLSFEDDDTFFNSLNMAGDSLGLWFDTDLNEGWTSLLMWGTGAAYPDAGSGHDDPPNWPGATVAAPINGQTMRYKWTNSSTPANNWVTDYNDHAGYRYNRDNDTTEIWYHIELPSMGLQLAQDVASGYTGPVTIKDESGDTTGGLPSSGSIQVGSSILTYNNKTATTITLTSAPAVNHVTGDPIYVYFGGVSSDGVPINRIRWTATSIYPKDFEILYSRLPNARTPGTSAYLNDYIQLANVTGHASNSYELTFSTTRARHIVMLVRKMSTDPARVRFNEFEVYLDRTYYDTSTWLQDGTPTTGLFETLLTLANIPPGAMTLTNDGNSDLSNVTTEKQNAWTVAADLADFTNHRLHVRRDSKITIAKDTFWTSGSSYTPVATWTRSNASEPSMLQDVSGIGSVSQVRLSWRSPDEEESGTECYPATADWRGSVVELGPYVYASASAAQAAARKQYWLRKYPYTMFVRPLTPSDSYAPGQIHRVQWDFSDTRGTMDRYYMVTSVSDEFGDLQRKQSLNMIQVSREIAN